MKYASIDRLFRKLKSDYGITDVAEKDVIEWAGEALEGIGAVTAYEQVVGFFEVKNHQVQVPSWLHMIIQIAKNNEWTTDDKKCFCPTDISDISGSCTVSVETEEEVVIVDPCECEDWGLEEYVPDFNATYQFGVWTGSNLYKTSYSPVKLANHTFMNSLVCDEDPAIYDNIYDEYTIVNGEVIRFSFQEGSVAIAYWRQKVDNNGFPMIPDQYSYMEAIANYIIMKRAKRDFVNQRQGSSTVWKALYQEWLIYCNQAANHAMMPKGVDEHQNLLEQGQHFFPKQKRYYGFFGKLSHPEHRKYNKANRGYKAYRYI